MNYKRLLVISPHPDDEMIAAGGLLLNAVSSGAAVKVIILTNGESNTLGHILWKKRIFISNRDKEIYGLERRNESLRALSLIGINDVDFWEYCDTGLFEVLAGDSKRLIERFRNVIADFRPDAIVYPGARDLHRDHSAVSLMVDFALERFSPSIHRLRYVNHGDDLLEPTALQGLGTAYGNIKLKLLKVYKSQFFLNFRKWQYKCAKPEFFLTEDAKYSREFSIEFQGEKILWIRSNFKPRWLNPASLYIVGVDTHGVKVCYFGRLKSDHELRLTEFSGKDKHIIVEVQTFNQGTGCYLKMKRDLFSGCDRIFIKARCKMSFFDDSGFSMLQILLPQRSTPRLAAVIPCYNISVQATEAVRRAMSYTDTVIAVDDGSTDGTADLLEELKTKLGENRLIVLRLPTNRGKGSALFAGLSTVLSVKPKFDLIATLDGDLQHHPEDLPRFAQAWRDGADFIIGCRAFRADAPLRSRLGNAVINWLSSILFPNAVSDTQSGFRAFSYELLSALVYGGALEEGRYEPEIGVLVEILKADIRIIEVDIPAIYLDRNRTSHFRPLIDSVRVVLSLFKHAFENRRIL